jgi:hypothetical protein
VTVRNAITPSRISRPPSSVLGHHGDASLVSSAREAALPAGKEATSVASTGKSKDSPLSPWVAIYDTDQNLLLYTVKTIGKKKFNVTLQNGVIPCHLHLDVGAARCWCR